MNDAPPVFTADTIRVPKGYGPGIERALRSPLYLRDTDEHSVEFVPTGTGLYGYALERIRDLGSDENGRRIEITFQVGSFGFKSVVKELNIWAGSTHGVEAFVNTVIEKHGHFVTKNGPQVTVSLLMQSAAGTMIIPIYPAEMRAAVEQMLRQRRPQARLSETGAKTHFDAYLASIAQVFKTMSGLITERWPHFSNEVNDAMAALASNVMTGQHNEKPFDSL